MLQKQKNIFLWVACILLVLILALTAVGFFTNPMPSVARRFEKAINQRDAEKLAACFAPADQSTANSMASLLLTEFYADGNASSDLQLLFCGKTQEARNEAGENTMGIKCILMSKGSFGPSALVNTQTLWLKEVDGKWYLDPETLY